MKMHFCSDTIETKSVYADLEPQFTLHKKESEKLSYKCNLCKPKNSVLHCNVKSRSNLKRHLTGKHGKRVKLVSYELNNFCHFVHGFSKGCK